ncbi:MAG: YaeQ family protein [Gammaproteobacteria bacterium]|nr:YaeQ family protein [Gammaproteobacteria bacterium]
MALKSTIFKVVLQIADMERDYYAEHSLTIARHPSETDKRMMLRLLAFCIDANEKLAFSKGISTDDEPDLWQHELHGEISHWIELGLPDERRIRKACSRARRVTIYTYNQRSFDVWWHQIENKLTRFDNLSIFNISDSELDSLGKLARRTMQLQCTIQDGDIWIGDGERSVHVVLHDLFA